MRRLLQEAAREREIEERERKLGALMAEKGAITQKKKTSKVCCASLCNAACDQGKRLGHTGRCKEPSQAFFLFEVVKSQSLEPSGLESHAQHQHQHIAQLLIVLHQPIK